MTTTQRESLAEDLLLLAFHNEHGTAYLSDKQLHSALAIATVMDLLLNGRIATTDGQVIVVDRSPLNDPVRDGALHCLAGATARMPLTACGPQIAAAIPDITTRLLDQLVARGVLARQQWHMLGIIPMKDRFPERDGRIEQDVRADLRAVALHGKQPDARTTVLATLVVGYRLEGGLFSGEERDIAIAQLRDIARSAHQRASNRPAMASSVSGIAATMRTAGAENVSGNVAVDVASDIAWGAIFDFVFDAIPGLIGAIFEMLDS